MRRKAYRVVSDVRHALDQSVYATTICINGKAKGSKTYFPFASDPDDFDTLFRRKGRAEHVAAALVPLLKSFEPWWEGLGHEGGNNTLRTLGKISGPIKHQVAMASETYVRNFHSPGGSFGVVFEMFMPPKRIGSTNDFLICSVPHDGQVDYKADMTFSIHIREITIPATSDAIAILGEFYRIGVEIVGAIKNETARVIGP